ncbi:MAG: tetratricopeptide repeat protein [Chitinophagales bacterium]|nr:tetratricopeptide repeat protein [Bacteroidota bacterium]
MKKLFFLLGIVSLMFISQISVQAQYTQAYYRSQQAYELGEMFFRMENYPLARHFYELVETMPESENPQSQEIAIDASYKIAQCSQNARNPNNIHLLTEFIKDYGNNRQYNSWANYELAQYFFKEKNYEAVRSVLENVEPRDLNNIEAENYYFEIGYSNFLLQNFAEAQEYFERVQAYGGEHRVDATYYLGFLAYEKKEYDQAMQYFSMVEDEPRFQDIIPYYVTLIKFNQKQYDEVLAYTVPRLEKKGLKYRTEMHKIVGQIYYDRQQYTEALPYLTYYVENSAKVSKDDLYTLAYTQYQFKQYDKAINNFLQLNTLDDKMGQNAMYHLGDCYLKTNQKEKAIAAFEAASQANYDPNIKENATFNAAKLAYEMQQYSKSINTLKDFILTYPNSSFTSEAQDILGKIFEQSKNYTEAMEVIESIPNKTPTLRRTYQKVAFNRAIDFLKDKNTNEALVYFNKSLQYPEDNNIKGLCYFWEGDMYYKQNNLSEAMRYFNMYLSTHPQPQAYGDASPGTANYSLGYCYYRNKDYANAANYFDAAIPNLQQNGKTALTNDAILRSGDCNFIQKIYNRAQQQYDIIVRNNAPETDYALYQTGMIFGLNKRYSEKINTLKQLNNQYPNSFYSDDALYQIATTQLLQKDYQSAIKTYQDLIKNYSESPYFRKSLIEIGLSHYNLGEFDAALKYYDQLIRNYPQSAEAKEALLTVKDVYITRGDADNYFKYVQSLPKEIQVSGSEQEKSMYQFAEVAYEKGNCDAAVKEFTSYLSVYPNGENALFAHFYRAECLYNNKQYEQAKPDYDAILASPNNIFREKALDRSARIAYFVSKDYGKAYNFYQEQAKTASDKDASLEALRGLTRTAYQLNKSADLELYANKLLRNEFATKEDLVEANFYLGKLNYSRDKLNEARTYFEKTAQLTDNEMGAEARYHIAKIYYRQAELDKAKTACFKVDRETPSQTKWVAKSFIVLAQVYESKGELYQAKATLKSIIDNYSGDEEVLSEARTNLNRVEESERKSSKLKDENSNNTLEMDDDN